MKRMIDLPIWFIGLLGLVVAVWQSMAFLGSKDPHSGIPDIMAGLTHLWWAVWAALVSIVFVVGYFVRHPRIEEEIHISR